MIVYHSSIEAASLPKQGCFELTLWDPVLGFRVLRVCAVPAQLEISVRCLIHFFSIHRAILHGRKGLGSKCIQGALKG